MPSHGSILFSTLRLIRKTFPSITNSQPLSDANVSSMTGADASEIHGHIFNVSGSTNANATAIPDYSTGLAGVNLALDDQFVRLIGISMGTVILAVFSLRVWQLFDAHIRHIYCLRANRLDQTYWTYDQSRWWQWLKREIIYAPLGKKRHNQEIQLSRAHNYGTLPGRIHTILLLLYALSNVIYCLVLPYGSHSGPHLIAELRGRSGMLATVNLIPLVLMAGRNNPTIPLLKISFDTFNLFHRWIGRIIVLEAITHVSAWYVNYAIYHPGVSAWRAFPGNRFLMSGLCAAIAMFVIAFQSLSPIRHAFYELFLHLHILLAFTALIAVYIHLEIVNLPALPYIRAGVFCWLGDRILRLVRIACINYRWRKGFTYVTVEALPAEACRVTFHLPSHMIITPGSHVYAYIPAISWWMSHPFSVAWTNVESEPPTGAAFDDTHSSSSQNSVDDSNNDVEKQIPSSRGRMVTTPTTLSLIVAARTGMTRKLFQAAQKGAIRMGGFVEGPYSGHDSLASYGTVVMYAGGAGITHHLIQIRHLIARARANTVATRKIVLVWTVRDLDALSWIQPWMDEILRMPGRKDIFKVELYVTRPKVPADYASPSSTIQLYPKRCDPGEVLDRVLPERVGAMMVTICGPGAFADEVRAAVRSRLHVGAIEMNEESFTW